MSGKWTETVLRVKGNSIRATRKWNQSEKQFRVISDSL